MTLTATYSPEDNKLRLYALARLDADTYERVKEAGFRWAPKQELFVAPAWTPAREDLLIELCGEIGDEDTSLTERAEERAERFEDFSDKRAQDADRARAAVAEIADAIPLGQPILVGHHSEKHARKDAERIENGMRKAVKMWETSKYWTDRAAGAIRHAKYKELPAVRARRIKGLEADQRKHKKSKKRAETFLAMWLKDGLTLERAKAIANYNGVEVTLPDGSKHWSAWSALDAGTITPENARDQCVKQNQRNIDWSNRWLAHLANRLAYERAMLQESGGIAADKSKPEKGGAVQCWCSPGYGKGWSYVKRVNKVSVTVEDNWGNGGANFTRTIPFDKLKAIMTKAEVDAKNADGLLFETACKDGFFVADAPPETKPIRQPEPETDFDRMKETLKAGVQVVTAPQLFPTPATLAARLVELAEIHEGHSILEPSAGTGALVRAIRNVAPEAIIEAVEISPHLAGALRLRGPGGVRCADFLALNGELGQFDRIIMNPPFTHGEDIKHILHARGKLALGGRLVAICANGPRQQESLQPLATEWIDLPADSFAEQGTNVNTAIVVIDG